tara:strand:+ start:722 stop:1276 length:555 start_codon:yes stop_codon:yes gene_type:complete
MAEIRKRPSFTPGARTAGPARVAPLIEEIAPLTEQDISLARAMARMLRATWGEFTHRKDELARLAALPPVMQREDHDELVGIIEQHRSKAAAMVEKISKAPAPVCDLSEAEVIVGLKHLTRLDQDCASRANERGWSKSTSSQGHWATAMLDIDRSLAIKAGRMLLPKHKKQLRNILPSFGRKRP